MKPSRGPRHHQQIVTSIETISYECARYLATVLSPLIGKTEHHVKNLNEFAKEVLQGKLDPDKEL